MKRLFGRELAEQRYGGICACGDHAWMRLTRGYVVLVDVDDGDIFLGPKVYSATLGSCGIPYAAIGGRILLQRTLLNSAPAEKTDFANGNSLDCRRRNLKRCDHSDAMRDRRVNRKSTSKFKGVRVTNRGLSWRAECRKMRLGLFPHTPEGEIAAARAYDDAARNEYGPLAALNFPAPGERSALRKFAPA